MLAGLIAVWVVVFGVLVWRRHDRYGTLAFDLGIHDQAIWLMARSDKPKTYSLDGIRQKYPRDYEKWTSEEDERLTSRYQAGLDIVELAAIFQRQPSAIESRLTKLGLWPQG